MTGGGPVSGRREMVAAMQPALDPECYAFVTVPDGYRSRQLAGFALASFREDEGWSFVVPEAVARDYALPTSPLQRRIVLQVHSSLEGVGLTAAVSGALADAGIACNCIAAFHHDHIFVPEEQAQAALTVLQALQDEARAE